MKKNWGKHATGHTAIDFQLYWSTKSSPRPHLAKTVLTLTSHACAKFISASVSGRYPPPSGHNVAISPPLSLLFIVLKQSVIHHPLNPLSTSRNALMHEYLLQFMHLWRANCLRELIHHLLPQRSDVFTLISVLYILFTHKTPKKNSWNTFFSDFKIIIGFQIQIFVWEIKLWSCIWDVKKARGTHGLIPQIFPS